MSVGPPFEILELVDGESRVMTVIGWEVGEATIKPARAPQGVTIRVLRVHVPAAEKPTIPQYWDITSRTLIGSWEPQLEAPGALPMRVRVTKWGSGPSARFTLEHLA